MQIGVHLVVCDALHGLIGSTPKASRRISM
jgi:hypothetical protein